MKNQADHELILLCKDGRRDAFNELVRRYQDRVYWAVRRFITDHDDALDVAQDVFVRAFENIGSFRGEAQVFTWLYRIAMNLSLNHIRRKKLRGFFRLDDFIDTIAEDPARDPLARLEKDETTALIEKAAAALPLKQRQVFMMRYYEELPYEEIAAILRTTVGGLKANYFHAIRKIEDSLQHALRHDPTRHS
ncbi:MAG: sigma-70 family RNA polymerase sigma factor [Ignavibacteria bacterium]|nr:sigma-70 family RNA polymerase sigma factor [Ignavibacteria bacterium]